MSISCHLVSTSPSPILKTPPPIPKVPAPTPWIDPANVECGLCRKTLFHSPIDSTKNPYTDVKVHQKCRELMRPLENHINNRLEGIKEESHISNDIAAILQKLQKLIPNQTLFEFMKTNKYHDFYIGYVNQAVKAYYQEKCDKTSTSKSIIAVNEVKATLASPPPLPSTPPPSLPVPLNVHSVSAVLPRSLILGRNGIHMERPDGYDSEDDLWR